MNISNLIFVADSSRRGLDTILRLHRLTREMGIKYDQLAIAEPVFGQLRGCMDLALDGSWLGRVGGAGGIAYGRGCGYCGGGSCFGGIA